MRVVIDRRASVAEVRLNRPDKLNAIDLAMFRELEGCSAQLTQTPSVRAVILAGNGPSFCVGIDLNALSEGSDILEMLADKSDIGGNLFQRSVLQWQRLPMPVIAAIHGHALGGGLQLALGADIRIISPGAKVSVREVAWGLVPDMAGTVFLRRLLREDQIRDLVFSGRIVSGEEAYELGLATRLADDPVAAARDLAAEIASMSPDAVRAGKRLLNLGASGASESDMLAVEAAEQRALLTSPNHREAIAAFSDNRPPSYRD
ncbi:crotonase/enoyl-CoA hydratase family protein [Novosphingobium sp. JCM 18896]|uniref:crotonase/enoyl-CoA hydratase family protein n=1 Tax=Novosphingobium sp. JCM 18896 TaxID=2989731 RepID=UPI0022235FA5|nr:crotonase/enoyl-CoA hydratase family protein [Novosphingobium sp. JCM 18896]MCW1432317.1 crotonase/enoyl-CoA hydratase family protein [Novosphingobium sp. JCM 18896]